jgi:hypothetical protein
MSALFGDLSYVLACGQMHMSFAKMQSDPENQLMNAAQISKIISKSIAMRYRLQYLRS